MGETPLVSVVVSVYNHAPYVEECLRSIAAQKTSFPFEVIVGEDCSPDGTAEVLRRLEPELPDNFTIICREKNLGAAANGEDLYRRARGTYLAHVEGDDFWTFDGRLQAQVDFLEEHPDYVAVYTRCHVVGEDSRPSGERYPQCPHDDYSFREFFYSRMPGQSATMLCRREPYLRGRAELLGLMEPGTYYPGDRRNAFSLLVEGRVRCLQSDWSAYRHVVRSGGSSYSSRVRFDEAYARAEISYGRALVRYAELRGTPEAVDCAKRTCYRFLLKWAADGRCSLRLSDALREVMAEPRHRVRYLLAPIQWYLVLGLRRLRGVPIDL